MHLILFLPEVLCKDMQIKLKKVASKLFPMKPYLANGIRKGFRFCFKSTRQLLFVAYNLLSATTVWPIEILSSINSTTLTQLLGIITIGIKLIDIGCKNLKTGKFTYILTFELYLV